MIETKNLVPEPYRLSRDYKVLLKLLDLIISDIDLKTNELQNLLNPDKCINEMLCLLSDFSGYEYDFSEDYKINRTIIKYFTKLIRNRGNRIGLLLAVALANISNTNTSNLDLNAYSNVSVEDLEINGETHKVVVFYVYNKEYLPKLQYLIGRVRPAGVLIKIVPAELLEIDDKLQMHSFAKAETPSKKSTIVDDALVGRSNVNDIIE